MIFRKNRICVFSKFVSGSLALVGKAPSLTDFLMLDWSIYRKVSGRHIPSTAPVAAPAPAQGRYINKVGGSRDDCTPPCTDQCWIEVFQEHLL